MPDADIYFTTLDRCRTAVGDGAKDFEALIGGEGRYPAKATDSLILSGPTGSGAAAGPSAMTAASIALAKVIDSVENSIADEGDKAAKKLLETERALDEVETNIRKADKAGEV
ncbi:hypothetical protein [Streptosporangium lutulentum]|uniref:Excreted virulence factor EspC, type VII ESX diderm n=1 Tax=Streptosporangium lutulentum TaxID=1461250 RepID=A0ABT9QTP4_9ACTN|nr:hypothetical protein [Streptosporangium lutulentum]MDP9849379.1 hypothetical protein [Streptosporangium lutulentum]